MELWQILVAIGVPSTVVGLIITHFFRKWEKRDSEREAARRKMELLQIRGTLSAMALGEATATALKNGHTNGETEKALKYEESVKHEIRDFLAEQGVGNII